MHLVKKYVYLMLLFLCLICIPFWLLVHAKHAESRAHIVPHHLPLQTVQQSSSAGIIDGAKTPTLIPTDRASHMILLAAATQDSSSVARERAQAFTHNVHQRSSDSQALAAVATEYRSLITATASKVFDSEAAYQGKRNEFLNSALLKLKTETSAEGQQEFALFVQAEKRRMKLFPLPSMNTHRAGIWKSIFSQLFPTVYAQMSPQGSTYTTESIYDRTLIASAITDASSFCHCHQSNSSARIIAPGGSAYQASTASNDELVQADASY